MDGQGFTAAEQFPTLGAAFDLFQMKLNVANRSSYEQLVDLSVVRIKSPSSPWPSLDPIT
jgi:hypothetical protein